MRSSSGASGGALVGCIGDGTANYLQFNNVSGTTAGSHRLTVYYASGESRSLTVSVNGAAATTLATPSTGGWDTVGSVATTVTLTSGANTVGIGDPTGWAPDIDRIVVSDPLVLRGDERVPHRHRRPDRSSPAQGARSRWASRPAGVAAPER